MGTDCLGWWTVCVVDIADMAKSCMPVPSDAHRRIAFGGGLSHDTTGGIASRVTARDGYRLG